MLTATPAAAAAPVGPASVPAGSAVVALSGTSAVTVEGVHVDAVLASIRSEVVHGSAAALHRLASAPGVRGVIANKTIKPTGYGLKQNGGSVFAWQGLGRSAGEPGAGAGVHVALIDTGVSDNDYLNRASGHLVDAIDTSPLLTGGAPTTDGVFADGYGHGTFMASLIAGGGSLKSGRGLGVAPGAVVDVVKVAGDDGSSSFASVMAGLNWVAQNAATESVASLSFGLDPADVGGYGQDPLNLAVETVRSLGTNVVVSAGNTAGQVTDPGFDPRVITVGAADTRSGDATVAPFSGSAVVAGVSKPDLVAPGVNLLGELPADSAIVADNPAALQANGFYRGSGTSEATAVVAGLAALFVADNPSATTAEVKASLRVAATPMGVDGSGAGLANVARRMARSRDDARMGDGGALGEATFDVSAWINNGWGADAWGTIWNQNRWGTDDWSTTAWSELSWDQNRWGSADWDCNRWGSDAWDFNRWGANRWGANRWGANRWGDNRWGDNRWGSATWGTESWGTDGSDGTDSGANVGGNGA